MVNNESSGKSASDGAIIITKNYYKEYKETILGHLVNLVRIF